METALAEVPTFMSIEAYLSTSFRPDCEYVDGFLKDRNVGEFDHGNLQGEIICFLLNSAREWGIRVAPALRVRVSQSRIRVPDVCVLSRDLPIEQIITHPPLICIEVLSEDDRFHDFMERVSDFTEMGVKHVWLFDPAERKAFICTQTGINEPEDGTLSVPETQIRIPLKELFTRVDNA
jgi:Uma2 family endonuclease